MSTEEQELSANLSETELAIRLAEFGESVLRILESGEDWGPDTLDAVATQARRQDLAFPGEDSLFKVSADLTPPCGHSACRQNYIETGERRCVGDPPCWKCQAKEHGADDCPYEDQS